ncbi:MAG: aminotransferase class V-fold PLP-dependent enzyme [Bacteroidota bacterium]
MTTSPTSTALSCQRDLFSLAPGDGFLNGAYMSPQLKSVHAAGIHALQQKNRPGNIRPNHFFEPVEELKKSYAQLIDCPEPTRIALIPAVSYGMATVAHNLPLNKGQNVVIPSGQFPSNYYSWSRRCEESGAELRIIECPETSGDRGLAWTDALSAAIDQNTALLACGHLHWADGTLYDLPQLRAVTKKVGAWLIIDGTQSVGALPFSVAEFQPDALICAGYKWLMGPYACAYAYYGPVFDEGKPIEDNWINRQNSDDFKNLVNYQPAYRPGAARYGVGEHSNFLSVPMQLVAIQQLLSWTPEKIQEYCAHLWQTILPDLEALGIRLQQRPAHHLVGIRLPQHFQADQLPAELAKRNLSVSFRGDAIRVAPNVYNRVDEMARLLDALRAVAGKGD